MKEKNVKLSNATAERQLNERTIKILFSSFSSDGDAGQHPQHLLRRRTHVRRRDGGVGR